MENKSPRTKKIATKDGYANFAAKLGQDANNLISKSTYRFQNRTNDYPLLEAMYEGSWIIGKVIDSVADDMVRAGIAIKGSDTPADISSLIKNLTMLGIWNACRDLIKWGRLYGGAIAVIQIEGQDTSTPLQMDSITSGQFRGLRIYDRRQVWPDVGDLIVYGPDAGLPKYYNLTSDSTLATAQERIHHSRVIRAVGFKLPQYRAIAYQLWGASVIERLYDRLVAYDAATAGVANLIHKAHLRTIKVPGLNQILAGGGQAEGNLTKRFKYLASMQNSEGVTILDGDDDYQADTYTFAGLADVTLSFAQQISGATGIPLVRLYGQSPVGLNSTGESDIQNYYDEIRAQQESTLKTGLLRVLNAMHQSILGTPAPDDFDFEFTPLWQTSAKEKIENAAAATGAILAAHDAGVLDAETTMQELKQLADATGIYTNITEEKIAEAKDIPPPAPETPPVGVDTTGTPPPANPPSGGPVGA